MGGKGKKSRSFQTEKKKKKEGKNEEKDGERLEGKRKVKAEVSVYDLGLTGSQRHVFRGIRDSHQLLCNIFSLLYRKFYFFVTFLS